MLMNSPSLGLFNLPPGVVVLAGPERVVQMSRHARLSESNVGALFVTIQASRVITDLPFNMSILAAVQEQTMQELLSTSKRPNPQAIAKIDSIRTRINQRAGILSDSAVLMGRDRRSH